MDDFDARHRDPGLLPWPRDVPPWVEWLAIASLVLLACCFLNISWRKWPDPQIDFGRELYMPWRLSLGDVLGRDIEPQYGPLSQYLNAGLFALSGPSLMALVSANLAIHAAILFSAYWLLRRGWGVLGAWTGCAVFVSVFSFSQFDVVGNYNYATPYSHEVTHGLLVCLLLAAALISSLRRPAPGTCALAGLLFGLAAILKAEVVLAASALVALTAFAHLKQEGPRHALRLGPAFIAGALLPSIAFLAYFSLHLPPADAILSTGRAWLNVVATTRFTDEMVQREFSGFDAPLDNLADQALATGTGLAVVASILLVVRLAERSTTLAGAPAWMRWTLAVYAAAIGLVAGHLLPWTSAGRALLGMAIAGLLINLPGWPSADRAPRGAADPAATARVLAGVLAIALMGRMLLYGRIQHYGFFQAAVAAMVVAAAMAAEWPARFAITRCGRVAASIGMLAVIGSGVAGVVPISTRLLEAKTLAVGSGADLFYAFPPQIRPSGELVRASSEYLSGSKLGGTALVLPEGVMVNYLSRRATPTASYRFFASDLADGREERLVDELRKNPPQQIVLLSRDLREFGIARYGQKTGEGQALLQWLAQDYQLAARIGGDPLDPRQAGLAIYRLKSVPAGARR